MIPLPKGFRLVLDPAVRAYRGGTVLVGGSPRRVIRLSAAGVTALRGLLDGSSGSQAARVLGRRLVDAGMARPVPPPVAGPATVTIVVPVRDRPGDLDRCLRAIGRGDPVIVVDDGSADPSGISAVCRRHGAHLERRAHPGGPGAARNCALRLVRTDYVAFLDSDCVPSPGWTQKLVEHLADPCVGAVAPRVRPLAPTGRGSLCTRFAGARSPLDMGSRAGDVAVGQRIRYVPSAALLARRAAMGAGFDEDLRYGEDVDLVWRVGDGGWRVRYAPEVSVHHREPNHWGRLLRRRFFYGTSAAPLARRHPGRLAPVVLRPGPALAIMTALVGRPGLSAATVALSGLRAGRRLRSAGAPSLLGPWSCAQAAVHTAVGIGRSPAILAPLGIAAISGRPRARRAALLFLLAPGIADWWDRPTTLDPLRFTAAAIADDLAYGVGVWVGCARARTLAPVMPSLGGRLMT